MLYDGPLPGQHVYRLRSLACAHGHPRGPRHCAFVQLPQRGGWALSDGGRTMHVGTWADVCRECEAAQMQPALLFYEGGP